MPRTEPGPEPASPRRDPLAAERAALIGRLFREHNHRLLRFLAARLASDQEAHEVAQEAYVRLLQLDQPGAIGFLRAFLFKTAANIATDRLRHRQVVRHLAHLETTESEVFAAPETKVVAQQELDILSAGLAELAPRCREAFLLSRLTDLSSEEIARHVGVSSRMVREYVVQALLHCRRRLDEAHGEKRTDLP
jgi:RNA polymerase sigma-70 factor (ECF subfamily)